MFERNLLENIYLENAALQFTLLQFTVVKIQAIDKTIQIWLEVHSTANNENTCFEKNRISILKRFEVDRNGFWTISKPVFDLFIGPSTF